MAEIVNSASKESLEAEREEFERVVDALKRAHRLSKLLHYLGEKYFSGKTDELTEYNIATEALGRDKNSFVANQDAIARVEAHRLRKWLKDYYDISGRDHPTQIVLPAGTYVPVFTHQCSECSEIEPCFEPSVEKQPTTSASELRGRRLFYGLSFLFLLALGIGIGSWIHWRQSSSTRIATQPLSGSIIKASQDAAVTAPIPLRLLLGYHSTPEPDSTGNFWQADQYYHGGWGAKQPSIFFAQTSDQFIFRNARFGDFNYKIPLSPGIYEVHFYFIATAPSPELEDDENKSVFNISINSQVILRAFDPLSDAMGINIADERVLRDISPASDGFLYINVSTVIGTPSLSAIEILHGTPHKQLPIRIATQTAPWIDHDGQLWHPDTYFQGGRRLTHHQDMDFGADATFYSSERYGHFSYAIPVDSRDHYTVVLHFAEQFFGKEDTGKGDIGSRVFRVLCNGSTLLDNFDIYREVGHGRPLVKTFYHLKPSAQGKLNLTFEPISNYATVSAIEVLDESN